MKYTEELLWILDEPGGMARTLEAQNRRFQIRREFVHSLGLKCDSVGWCKMDLSNSHTSDILDSISEFCKKYGWKARGLYTRRYVDVNSDWYELVPAYFKDNTPCDRIETLTENGKKIYTRVIRAFHEISPAPKMWADDIYVPERFRNFCMRNGLEDLDFCWVKDMGKYEAEQYFHIYGKHLISEIAVDFGLGKADKDRIQSVGGWLPAIDRVFHEMQQINLPDCYLAEKMPEAGIVYAYIPSTFSCVGRHVVLIHKDIAEMLVQQKILPASTLRPAPVVDTLPGGYVLKETQTIERPAASYRDEMLSEYEKLKQTDRPVRMILEREALKILRGAKKERKEGFQKAMSKAKTQDLLNTRYYPLVPYYCVANGGYLSDEYELLSWDRAKNENDAFQKNLESEELLECKPEGVVFAQCPDGDKILLCENGEVIRFSHEVPEIVEQWPSLSQFVVDAINE